VTVAEAARETVLQTLGKMAKAGSTITWRAGSIAIRWMSTGWCRTSRKMAYDNSELLKNYVHAYQAFGNEEFAQVARRSWPGWTSG